MLAVPPDFAVGTWTPANGLVTFSRTGDPVGQGYSVYRPRKAAPPYIRPDGWALDAQVRDASGTFNTMLGVYDAQGNLTSSLVLGSALPAFGSLEVRGLVVGVGLGPQELTVVVTLQGPGVTSANDEALIAMHRTTGAPRFVLREGSPAPGLPGPIGDGRGSAGFFVWANNRGQSIMSAYVLASASGSPIMTYDPARGVEVLIDNPNQSLRHMGIADNGDFAIALTGSAGFTRVLRSHLGDFSGITASVSATTGGSHRLAIDRPADAGKVYFIAGTTSGTRPGFPVANAVIPLNVDAWTYSSLGAVNSTYSANFGVLDNNGSASSTLTVPPGVPAFIGTLFHHSCIVLETNGRIAFTGEPVSLRIF